LIGVEASQTNDICRERATCGGGAHTCCQGDLSQSVRNFRDCERILLSLRQTTEDLITKLLGVGAADCDLDVVGDDLFKLEILILRVIIKSKDLGELSLQAGKCDGGVVDGEVESEGWSFNC